VITLTFAWWWIPAAITAFGVVYSLFIYDDGGGFLSGLGNLMLLGFWMSIAAVAWAVAGFLK